MARYWLTPVLCEDEDVILLKEREELSAEQAAELMNRLKTVHPRMLVSFKANLLLSEEAEAACGVDEVPFALSSGESIVFGAEGAGETLELSHCAQAYLDRLPSAAEFAAWLIEAEALLQGDGGSGLLSFVHTMRSWLERGWSVTLLREDE